MLDRLDADAQLATGPDTYAADISLAMSLRQSITSRYDELVAAWDSGRVGPNELARIAVLLWGRLTDPLGGPSAFTLTEAGTLVAALTDRIAGALAADAVAGSGVAARIAPLRGGAGPMSIARGGAWAARPTGSTRWPPASNRRSPSRIAPGSPTAVAELEPEVTGIERDLIKDTGLRTSTAHASPRAIGRATKQLRSPSRRRRRAGATRAGRGSPG